MNQLNQSLTINNLSDNVQFTPNVAGVLTPVWAITVPEKEIYRVMDGALLIMKLKDALDNELAPHSQIVIAGIKPGHRLPTEVDGKDYRPFSVLSLSEQYDTNKNQAIRLKLRLGHLDLLETHKLLINVLSDTVVDEDNSLFELNVRYQSYRDGRGR